MNDRGNLVLPGRRVVLASDNHGKRRELQLLVGDRFELVPQGDLDVVPAEESAITFVENALIKARNAALATGLPALADDSGLATDHLGGAPGVRSSRYAGENASDEDNNRELLRALDGVPEQERTARFHCVLVLLRHAGDPAPLICTGTWEGRILTAPRGHNGFGYDPLFYVPELARTSAELSAEEKGRVSHRARALRALLALLE